MATVLLVDDEPAILSSLSAVLQAHGHDVMGAANGLEALRIAAARRPDVVVSDCAMPVTDGPALYRLFQAHPTLQTVPFIFMSGTESALNLPQVPFFGKPFDARLMLETIRAHLGAAAMGAVGRDCGRAAH